jgi:hypothetical protein
LTVAIRFQKRSSITGRSQVGVETADISRAANAVLKVVEAGIAIGSQVARRVGQF